MQEELNSTIIIQIIITICLYLTGLYYHAKVIKVSKKDKEMTWKLDLTNSCFLIAHHGNCVIMGTITYIIQDLHTYTGEWFCYTSKALNFYGNFYTGAHSMIVSLLKYILIVHWKRSRDFGKDKVKTSFFWINIFFAGVMICIHLFIRPDLFVISNGYARIDRCLGDPNNNWSTNSTRNKMFMNTVCETLVAPSHDDYFAYAIYILRNCICYPQVVFEYIMMFNVLEIVVYCRIFAFMRR
jgi:hypothetical protein